MPIQMKAIEQYFHVVPSVYYAVQGGFNFKSVDETLLCDQNEKIKWKLLSSTFMWYC